MSKDRTYEPPKLTQLGSLEVLTQGHATGNSLDKSFPTHTPEDQLTFS
jgi:hypothetical protein